MPATVEPMEIRPILSSLRKHRIPAALIVIEIALACAVLCNAVFLINQRLGAVNQPNAIDESSLSIIQMRGDNPQLAAATIPRNLAALRKIPGVESVAAFNSLPLSESGWNASVQHKPGKLFAPGSVNVTLYMYTRGGGKTLGLHLLKGRLFRPAEFADGQRGKSQLPTSHVVVITHSLAQRLWPGQSALGKQVWIIGKYVYTVVGVVADVLRPNMNGQGLVGFHWDMLFPLSPQGVLGSYVVRSAPQDRARILHAGITKLQALAPNAVVKGQTFSAMRGEFFAANRSMVWTLAFVCVVMLAVTAFGIIGLTSFWVGQRRRQIGIRRALGANRGQILRYFQTENFLLSTVGVVLGVILAFGVNLYLMQHYQMLRMPWYYLPASAVALWIVGQLAVLAPARRAANVPPVVATRSV